MKAPAQNLSDRNICLPGRTAPSWARRITPGLEFNARAVRARAGLLNVLTGGIIVIIQTQPHSIIVDYALMVLLFDMVMAVIFGLTPYSPLGVTATILSRPFEYKGTPHLPKRFAWTLGSILAGSALFLELWGAQSLWTLSVLGVLFVLTWLDAALGFCMGCWIYSKLFDCQSCRIG